MRIAWDAKGSNSSSPVLRGDTVFWIPYVVWLQRGAIAYVWVVRGGGGVGVSDAGSAA